MPDDRFRYFGMRGALMALATLALLGATSACHRSDCAAKTGDGICVEKDQASADAE